MFLRYATSNIKEIYDCSKKEDIDRLKTKVASIKDESVKKEAEKFVAAIEPDYVYFVNSGLHGGSEYEDIKKGAKSGFVNENGDHFPWSELLTKKNSGRFAGKHTFETWVGCPTCLNHDINAQVGEIVDSFPIKNEKSIDFLHRVDAKKNDNIAKGLRNGSIKGTSMGVMVSASYCSICDNLAYNEDDWCQHLSPRGLNIKGKTYTGQDGNKYPTKIGTLCYEINTGLEGVEDSLITLGEPADSGALIREVLASKKEDNNMPKSDGSPVIAEGVRYKGSGQSDGSTGQIDGLALSSAIQNMLRKNGMAWQGGKIVASANPQEIMYKNSREVIKAIDSKKLPKSEALKYVSEFKIVAADKIDDLTPSKAYDLLKRDANEENMFNNLMTQGQTGEEVKGGGDQAVSESEAKPAEQPNPDGGTSVKTQIPTDTSDENKDTNTSKPEDAPEPKTTDMTTAKKNKKAQSGEEVKGGGDQAVSESEVKPEDTPTPDGSVAPHSQLETDVSKENADVNTSKPEDGMPEPDGSAKPKSQGIPTNTSTEADDVNGSKPEDGMPEPTTAKKVKADDVTDKEVAEMTDDQKLNKLLDLVGDMAVIKKHMDGKGEGGEPKEHEKSESPAEEKKEDKPEGNKPPFMKDKPEAPKSEMPKEDKELPPLFSSYTVAFKENTKIPEKSAYIVSLGDKQLWMIDAVDAFGKKASKQLVAFKSEQYKDKLLKTLNKEGLNNVYTKRFAGFGTVLAQDGNPLPENTFEEPAKDMNVAPAAEQDITNNDEKSVNYTEALADILATSLATTPGANVDQVVQEFISTFENEEAKSRFVGMLKEKVEQKKKDLDLSENPENYSEPEIPAGGAPAPEGGDMSMAAMKKKVNAIYAALPEIKQELVNITRERDELKKKLEAKLRDDVLKARVTKTAEIAKKKVEFGLTPKENLNKEAFRLANLTDKELDEEIKIFENSLKIARKIKNDSDYSNIETPNKNKVLEGKPVLASIPTQIETEVSGPNQLPWSKGFQKVN